MSPPLLHGGAGTPICSSASQGCSCSSPYTGRSSTNPTKKIAFLVTFITLFVIFSVLMFEYFANGPYFVPYAMVPVVILVFF